MDADISAVAALIGDATRAQMLWALMGGPALPAGELAMSANVAPQTASAHLSKLLEANLLSAEVQGRHRYYRLASGQVAAIIEALAVVAPRRKESVQQRTHAHNPLRFARTCYNHLAGSLAVQITNALIQRGVLAPEGEKEYRVTYQGRLWFQEWGIQLDGIKSRRSLLARACLDWTERRHHLAGPLGTALLQQLLEMRWLMRIDRTRMVRVTTKGQHELHQRLGIEFRR